jgi:type I restriction enzyme R subunit
VSEYLHVEKPFLDQLGALGWTIIDQGQGFIPTDPGASLRDLGVALARIAPH